MIDNCTCDKKKITLLHQPKPLSINRRLKEIIEYLLWYVPNINSVQSYKSDVIKNALYDDFLFDFICDVMALKQKDIKFYTFTKRDKIKDLANNYFSTPICTNCPKIMLTRNYDIQTHSYTETKTECLLRHIRNIIAHGSFTLVNDLLIGKDINKYNNVSAVIKLPLIKLNSALETIATENYLNKESLIVYSFALLGYSVNTHHKSKINNSIYDNDLVLTKNNKKYLIEIKRTISVDKLNNRAIINQLTLQSNESVDYLILIIDNLIVSNDLRSHYLKNNIIILDQKDLEKIFSGQDIMLSYVSTL